MKALLVVDIQNDFCSNGALPVPGGEEVVPVANKLINKFAAMNRPVVAVKDWHPLGHGSFASSHGVAPFTVGELHGMTQVMWPDHCVQGTFGAAFHPDLLTIHFVFHKGTDPTVDSYSGFFDNGGRNDTGLNAFLRENRVDEIFILGLATDYCVKFTAHDAVRLGYTTNVVIDGCRGIDLPPGTVDEAIEQMKADGVRVVMSDEIR